MENQKQQQALDTATFLRVRKWYLLALAMIALTIIVAQILIQQHLNLQLNDSRVINVAGRQRAFSQKLVKEVLLFGNTEPASKAREKIQNNLKQTLFVWKTSHSGLQNGNDSIGLPKETNKVIMKLFADLNPHHKAMVNAAEIILKERMDEDISPLAYETQLEVLLANESVFLNKMDAIVNEYDALSKEKLQKLKFKEYLLLALSLLILFLEVVFIFRPLSIQIRETISKLIQSQIKSENRASEVKRLFKEKERSLQQLQELNFVIDNAALFASIRKNGTVVFISKKFLNLLGITEIQWNVPLSEILTDDAGQQQYLREILTSKRKSIRNEEIEIRTKTEKPLWLDMSIIPMHHSSLEQSVLILCSDITERKKNQLKIEELTKQNYEERMQQKQLQASQIVEGQEEERKRIAKDIHDGIGQMLTALKFNIESINPDQ
ncbi:MAG: type IV pili methyl-accepting chemotaxis transducer N-terminal domain-containing protein, partial [Bacteroidota bacterium]